MQNKNDIATALHLPQAPTDTEKFSYIIKRPVLLKLLYAMGMLSWIGVLLGYFQFFNNNIWYYVFIAPVVLYITFYQFLSIGINFLYKKFNTKTHNSIVSQFWKNNSTRYSINVFLPVCGEDINILRNTWEGVATMANPQYDMIPVVLDDNDHPQVRQLAQEFGFSYIVRPNRGHMKKAGNLKYGFEQTNGDFIIILDADFKPRYDFILDTLPYMSDPKLAIVQTPQFFDNHSDLHSKSPLQAGAGNVQEYFYKIIQTARNNLGGAICVGSCALYRRSALNSVGGTAQIEHSEDVHTGFSLIDAGFKLKYIPVILSKGVCPDDMHAFFKQQTRWCNGSMSMMVSKKFWQSKISWLTKLCYVSGFLFYISNPLKLLLTFQTFLIIGFHSSNMGIANLALFVPLILCSILIQYFYIYPKAKIGTILAHSCTVWFYSYTLLALVFGHIEGWKPTGIKSSLSRGFTGIARFTTIYLAIYLSLALVMTQYGKLDFTNYLLYPVIFWMVINVSYHLHFWVKIQDYVKDNHQSRFGFLKARKLTTKFVIFGLLGAIAVSAVGQFIGSNSQNSNNAVADAPIIELEAQDTIGSRDLTQKTTQAGTMEQFIISSK